jgi:phage-related baseplate assembly protein
MSRYSALDLSTLPPPTGLIELDFETVLSDRLTALEARLQTTFGPETVADIMALARAVAASPMRYLNEAAAAREIYVANQINAAIRSVFLATATGASLDQIGAGRGVVRQVKDDSNPEFIVWEGDDEYRARIQLSIEAHSPHGPEGAYVYWALDSDPRVVDVVAYGPNSGLVPPVDPANAKIVILSSEGDGTATQDLIDTVYDALVQDKRRPVADRVEVVSATPVPYAIDVTLQVTTPEAASTIEAAALARLEAFKADRIRIGRTVRRTTLAAALAVEGVVDVVINSPAADVVIGALEAPHCTSSALAVQSITGGWRDV